MVEYWRQLSRRITIKAALPHLLLGVLAAGLSLASNQNTLSVRVAQYIDISAVVSVITNGEQQKHTNEIANHQLPQENSNSEIVESSTFTSNQHSKIALLADINGIRAGPATI